MFATFKGGFRHQVLFFGAYIVPLPSSEPECSSLLLQHKTKAREVRFARLSYTFRVFSAFPPTFNHNFQHKMPLLRASIFNLSPSSSRNLSFLFPSSGKEIERRSGAARFENWRSVLMALRSLAPREAHNPRQNSLEVSFRYRQRQRPSKKNANALWKDPYRGHIQSLNTRPLP